MPNRQNRESDPHGGDEDDRGAQPVEAASLPVVLGPEQLDRWARLISDGEAEIPDDLSIDQKERLVVDVLRRRRVRLVRFNAHTIAWEIHSRDAPKEEENHDHPNV